MLLLPAILVGVAAVASGSVGENAARPCAGRVSCLGGRLPAPVTIAPGGIFGSTAFRVGRDGRIRRIPAPATPWPREASYFPGTGTWYMLENRHLVVGRGRKALWRSRGEVPSRNQLGVIAAGTRAVAFQREHKLYIAPLGGAERPVADRELPLGWTTGGLYTYRYQGRQLLLRRDTGALVKVIARRPLGSDYQVAGGSLYFISRGVLMSAHGASVERLASLSDLGLSEDSWLQPLGRWVELQDNHRLVVVEPDGSVFASTSPPRTRGQTDTISSALAVAPGEGAVAFTAASGRTAQPSSALPSSGVETVYLLRSGAHAAIPVHRDRVTFAPCERGASLQWHGHWLLYSATEGNVAAIDTADFRRTIQLGRLIKALPGLRDGFGAYWSAQAPVI